MQQVALRNVTVKKGQCNAHEGEVRRQMSDVRR